MKTVSVVFVFFLLFVVSATHADLYQYKDENGTVVITDSPPQGKNKSVEKFKENKKEPPPAEKPAAVSDAPGQGPSGAKPLAAPGSVNPEDKKVMTEQELQKKRDEAAARLEAEANKLVPFSSEKQREQFQQLEKAKKIKSGEEPVPE